MDLTIPIPPNALQMDLLEKVAELMGETKGISNQLPKQHTTSVRDKKNPSADVPDLRVLELELLKRRGLLVEKRSREYLVAEDRRKALSHLREEMMSRCPGFGLSIDAIEEYWRNGKLGQQNGGMASIDQDQKKEERRKTDDQLQNGKKYLKVPPLHIIRGSQSSSTKTNTMAEGLINGKNGQNRDDEEDGGEEQGKSSKGSKRKHGEEQEEELMDVEEQGQRQSRHEKKRHKKAKRLAYEEDMRNMLHMMLKSFSQLFEAIIRKSNHRKIEVNEM